MGKDTTPPLCNQTQELLPFLFPLGGVPPALPCTLAPSGSEPSRSVAQLSPGNSLLFPPGLNALLLDLLSSFSVVYWLVLLEHIL